MKGPSKDVKQLIEALESQGFSVQFTKNGHLRVRNSEGRLVATMASTPSDPRGFKNAISYLRKAGFIWKR